jgi:bilirubin oxidase
VRWVNQLTQTVNGKTRFLPHLLPVDPSLHWANPAGPIDSVPSFTGTPAAYTGPVPMAVHVHGAHVGPESDGYPEAWFLPEASDVTGAYHQHGSSYERNKALFVSKHGGGNTAQWSKNSAVFQYPNNQRAGTLWYHDHTLGMTRANVYAGPAGFYLLRGGPAGAPLQGTLPSGEFEIPVVIQDRSFNQDGSLFFPDSREFFDDFSGPFEPESDMHPIWNPEFFGNTLVVNGNTWPKCTVKRQRYRIRLLNGCNARTLMLRLSDKLPSDPSAATALPFWVIGTEGGLLPDHAVQTDRITLMPAERYDVIIDFSQVAPGSLYLVNDGPDEPFGGGEPPTDFDSSDPATTGVVLRFDISAAAVSDPATAPAALVLPAFPALPQADFTRRVSLNELDSETLEGVGPLEALLGTVAGEGSQVEGIGMRWMDKPTEVVLIGNSEVWEIYNFTEDAHPIHLHQVMFRVTGRQPIAGGALVPPEPYERGWKDTVVTLPGWITRIQAKFDVAGRFVWHCHIIDHEDNEMMRPYDVVLKSHIPMMGK